ncbi:ABC-2 type transport system permease protein [Cytobacillus eiseniae]|uniref:ABC-2 type transport system permease protein n=1 Tax=Cytobacillus eiseniae TaxID=762947 RepID=A0ABS4RK39_9BACI|nr:ABC transporter permease subunit [Cytobacillus eiseniae]MBP2243275.1 ABC-2 type transport system permease protein [Cytobacillus eiseniae]
MRNFIVLFKKEMKESMRSGKWIWLPIVMMVIGISQPLTSYYMPQILEMAGNLPEGTVIEIPMPTGAEVLVGTMSQYGTIGTLLFVLALMNVISHERQTGSLSFVMVRPVSALQYIISKYISQLSILLVALAASYLLTWYYTTILFDQVPWHLMLASLAIYSLWIIFLTAVTLFVGTLLRNSGGIAGVSVLFLGVISILTTLLPKYMEWSPGNLRQEASKILIEGEWGQSASLVSLSTLALSILFLGLAVLVFKKFERFGN